MTNSIKSQAKGKESKTTSSHRDETGIEENFHLFFNPMLNGVALQEIICDEQGKPVNYRFLKVNPAFETLSKLKASDVIGKTVTDFDPDFDEEVIQFYGDIALNGGTKTHEIYSIGAGKHFEVSCYSPEPGKFITVSTDISAYKEVEQIRQMRLDLMDQARDYSIKDIMRFTVDRICEITHSPIGFFHYFKEDENTIILQAWSTQTREEFCEVTVEDLHYPADQAGVWADCLRARKGIIHNHYPALTNKKGLPEGHTEILRELAVPVFRDEKIVAVLGIGNRPRPYLNEDLEKVTFLADTAWEICELKIADEKLRAYNASLEKLVQIRTEELKKSNEALKSFAYSVAHDLRAPLRSIRGFGDILIEEYLTSLDEDGQFYLKKIISSADKMDKLILALLEFSRVSNQETSMDTVNLSDIVKEVIETYQQQEKPRDIHISIEEGLHTEGDPQLLRILLDNLLSNAWKYTGQTPNASIQFGRKNINEQSVFFITDNGVGFDMKYAKKIFTPFQRLHDIEEFEGTGIGLSTAEQVVHRHYGEIWVEAEKGKGATFYFTLGTNKA